jgi:hypothetical protein
MAHDVVSMTDIFPACRDILDKHERPLHYAQMTELALGLLRIPVSRVNLSRQIEDVREKMLLERRHGSFYVGFPYCYAAVDSWFVNNQFDLFNHRPPILIPGNTTSGINGAYEALQRYPNMEIKNQAANENTRKLACARGLVIERHVADWFKKRWPEIVLSPNNHEVWDRPCNHDFKLQVANRTFNIDVFGPKLDGTYGKPPKKKPTDFHLMCQTNGKDILWEGVITRKQYNRENYLIPEIGRPPIQMIVWLNCIKHNIPYDVVRAHAS